MAFSAGGTDSVPPHPSTSEVTNENAAASSLLFGKIAAQLINSDHSKGKNPLQNTEDLSKDDGTKATDHSASQPKATSSTCIPKATERIKVELPSHRINGEIQFLKDHALIGKFLGFWPTEKALHGWIDSKWKPKGQISLMIGPKGFFTVIFYCLEDKTRVFEGGPYFFNSSGLFLRDWKPRFNPDTEDLSHVPVWIRLYGLPTEYWKEETLKDIGNSIGTFIKVAEDTKYRRFTSYARICVQMQLKKTLAETVSLFHDDFEWLQSVDYEHIPFRCRRCHVHGHLFRECPLNAQAQATSNATPKDSDGFTKVTARKRHAKKNPATTSSPSNPESSNQFQILTPHETPLKPSKDSEIPPGQPFSSVKPSSKGDPSPPSSSKSPPSMKEHLKDSAADPQATNMDLDAALALSLQEGHPEDFQDIPSNMEEDPETVSLDGLDILTLEAACKQKAYNAIPPWEIDRLEGVLIKAQRSKYLGIQPGSLWDSSKILKETKKRGRKTELQRTIILGEILMESGRFPKLTKFYKPKPQSPS